MLKIQVKAPPEKWIMEVICVDNDPIDIALKTVSVRSYGEVDTFSEMLRMSDAFVAALRTNHLLLHTDVDTQLGELSIIISTIRTQDAVPVTYKFFAVRAGQRLN